MRLIHHCLATLCLVLLSASPAFAHFGMVIPAEPMPEPSTKVLNVDLAFTHPFTLVGMELVKPAQFYVVRDGNKEDLLASLKKKTIMDHTGWTTAYRIKRPGVHTFFMEPTPYWEPAEDCSIIHYTKVVVAAWGGEDGWDEPLGVKTEIVPMLRPFGNYAGMEFVGQVLLDGKPVPNAEVEVEYYNKDDKLALVSDYHQTHVVKAGADGVFSFACPQAGWWGFAALNTADFKVKNPQGADKDVELGAVLWTWFDPWKTK